MNVFKSNVFASNPWVSNALHGGSGAVARGGGDGGGGDGRLRGNFQDPDRWRRYHEEAEARAQRIEEEALVLMLLEDA